MQEQVGSIQQQLSENLTAARPRDPPELVRLLAAWPTLPPQVKTRILSDLEGHHSKAA